MFSEPKENSWELLRSAWCPTEISTPGHPCCRLGDFSLETFFVVIFYYCFPDHWVFLCKFTVFFQLWGSIRAGHTLCATSTSLPSHWDTEVSSGQVWNSPGQLCLSAQPPLDGAGKQFQLQTCSRMMVWMGLSHWKEPHPTQTSGY